MSVQAYPKSVWFIICTEFCERFSYYGLRSTYTYLFFYLIVKNVICLFFTIMNVFFCKLAVLVLYLTSILQYDEDESTIIYHMSVFMAYFSPLFGAILSDSFLGKFK